MNQRARNRRFVATVGVLAGVVALLLTPAWFAGYRWNDTDSLPRGLWRIAPLHGLPERGQIVSFCPVSQNHAVATAQARGYLTEGFACDGGLALMFKRVIGLPDDIYTITNRGIVVNGTLVPKTVPVAADGNGAELPDLIGFTGLLDDQVLVVSDWSPWSFDSRYFGALPLSAIRASAEPVWLMEH